MWSGRLPCGISLELCSCSESGESNIDIALVHWTEQCASLGLSFYIIVKSFGNTCLSCWLSVSRACTVVATAETLIQQLLLEYNDIVLCVFAMLTLWRDCSDRYLEIYHVEVAGSQGMIKEKTWYLVSTSQNNLHSVRMAHSTDTGLCEPSCIATMQIITCNRCHAWA